jgi:hypothetical protein
MFLMRSRPSETGPFTGNQIRPSAVSDTNRETSDMCPEGKLFSNSTVRILASQH